MRHTLHLVALLVLAASGVGQSFFIPDKYAYAGGCDIIPFGFNTRSTTWSNQTYQQMVLTSDLGSKIVGVICDLAFAPCTFGTRHFDTIEIVIGQTTAATMQATFANNLVTNQQTVLKARNYDWHNSAADTWSRIGLDRSYLYFASNGNLVIQITVTGAYLDTTSTAFPGYHTADRQRVYSVGWASTPPAIGTTESTSAQKIEVIFSGADLHTFGLGCKGSNGKAPALSLSGSAALGNSLGMHLADALPNSLLFHNVALSRSEPAIDLGMAGAPGCSLFAPIQVLLPGVTGSQGEYALKAQVPNNSSLICVRLFTQMFPRDRQANPFGMTASNYGRILVGN